MKTCPECGSLLADNEPYCENCGFDPGFDSGSWNNGQRKSAKNLMVIVNLLKIRSRLILEG